MRSAEKTLKQGLVLGEQKSFAASYDVRDALGRAYSTLGDFKIKMGVHSEAVEPYMKLLALETQLARDRKDPRAADSGISLAHTKLGDVLGRLDRPREALDHLRVALAIDGRLSAAEPNNMTLTRKLFMTYNMLGRLVRSRGGQHLLPQRGQGLLHAAAGLGDKMVAADPDNRLALTDSGSPRPAWASGCCRKRKCRRRSRRSGRPWRRWSV